MSRQFLCLVSVIAGLAMVACGASVHDGGPSHSAPVLETLGGTVSGLAGTVVLENNGADDLTLPANGGFTFATEIPVGSAYAVTVLTQPVDQTCTVSGGDGTANGPVTNVTVTCVFNSGALDPSFASAGALATPLSATSDAIYGLAIQSDQKIVAAGMAVADTGESFAVARFNIDGSLDADFATAGLFQGFGTSGTDAANAVTVQADGKIVAVGQAASGSAIAMAVMRLNTDGTLDGSFAGTGSTLISLNPTSDVAQAVAIQPDNNILVGGTTALIDGSYAVAMARLDASGNLDASFGTAGLVQVSLPALDAWIQAMTLQADGSIVAAGLCWPPAGTDDQALVMRFSSAGVLDTTFGGTGYVLESMRSLSADTPAVAVDSQARIVSAGYLLSTPAEVLLNRRTQNGDIDAGFGTGGWVQTAPFSTVDNAALALGLQADGKLVVGGYSGGDLLLMRFLDNGQLDTSFGTAGAATYSLGTGNAMGTALAIQADGKLVLAGSYTEDVTFHTAMIRVYP